MAAWLTLSPMGLDVGVLALRVLGMLSCVVARRVLCRNFDAIARECGEAYNRDLLAEVCRVIGKTLDMDPAKLQPEQRFIEDLHIN